MTETYVVTGGAGFIGSHIAERLIKDGHQVRIIDNMLTGNPDNLTYLKSLEGDLEIIEGSITDLDTLQTLCKGVYGIFHQAALPSVPRSITHPLETHEHCITGTLNVLIAARDNDVKRVVYAASSSAYGDQEGDFKVETMAPAPISPYGVAKLAGEYYLQAFYHSYGLETVALRYFNVFGARQDPNSAYAAVIPKFINMMLRGEHPTIHGDGTQSRDFTYIDNVVHGNLLAAMADDAPGETINMATGGQVTLNELVDNLNVILETNLEPIHGENRTGDIKHSRAGIDKAGELLGFEPVVDFEEGLRRTTQWYREQF
jgi:nucleoside-diphosphate-sugar epimerase